MTAPLVLVVAGTRPELQKVGGVVNALRAAGVPTAFLWTGQHSDAAMTTAFAAGLGWPEPDGRIEWDARWHMRPALIRAWWQDRYDTPPEIVLVQGDTDSGVSGARSCVDAAWERRPRLVHLEAGLRSWEPTLPEERNRREIDRHADLLLCPSPLAAAHAKVDAKPGARIVVTGQTGLDALVAAIDATPSPPPVSPPYALLTLHRAALVDDPDALLGVLAGVSRAMRANGMSLALWPVHPRLQGERYAACFAYADIAGIRRVAPLPYGEMAAMLGGHDQPRVVISDSGGLVEEACFLGIPTVIVRPATERWELVARGDADLVRPENAAEGIAEAVTRLLTAPHRVRFPRSPYGSPCGDLKGRPTANVVREVRRALGHLCPPDPTRGYL